MPTKEYGNTTDFSAAGTLDGTETMLLRQAAATKYSTLSQLAADLGIVSRGALWNPGMLPSSKILQFQQIRLGNIFTNTSCTTAATTNGQTVKGVTPRYGSGPNFTDSTGATLQGVSGTPYLDHSGATLLSSASTITVGQFVRYFVLRLASGTPGMIFFQGSNNYLFDNGSTVEINRSATTLSLNAAVGTVQTSSIMYHECCKCIADGSGQVLIGPSFGVVLVNPDNTPASAPSSTKEATCLVSGAHFVSWDGIGPDSTSIGTTTSGTSTGGVVVSVSMSGSNYIDGDHPSPGSAHLESRNTGSSYSADFSGNESLVYVHAENATVTLTFSTPVLMVGFRVQKGGFGTNNNFFISTFTGLSVTTSAYSPFSDTAPFYGISSGTPFSSITFGFNSATPFAFSTLELCVP